MKTGSVLSIRIESYIYEPPVISFIEDFMKRRRISNELLNAYMSRVFYDENTGETYFSYELTFKVENQDFEKLFKKVSDRINGIFSKELIFNIGLCEISCENCILRRDCDNDINCDCITSDFIYFKPNWNKTENVFIKQVLDEKI